jgi:hypothetical protein
VRNAGGKVGSESVLLTDSTEPAVGQAIEHLDGWAIEHVAGPELEPALSARSHVRALVVTSRTRWTTSSGSAGQRNHSSARSSIARRRMASSAHPTTTGIR